MAEELKIKVDAETGAAVADLNKTEKAVDEVKNAAKELGTEGTKGVKEFADETKRAADEAKRLAEEARKSAYEAGQAERRRRGEIRKKANAGSAGAPVVDTANLDKQIGKYTKILELVGKLILIYGVLKVAIGAVFDAMIKSVNATADLTAKQQEAEVQTIKYEAAMRLANRGLIDLGGTHEEFIARYDAYVEKTQRGAKATEDATRALAAYKRELAGVAEAIANASVGKDFTILSPEDADKLLDPIRSLATGLENALKKAFEVGGEGERAAWAAANEDAVEKVIAAYEKMGAEVPEHIRAVGKARQEDASALNAWVAAMDAATQAIMAQRAALNDLDLATSQWAANQQKMANLSGQTKDFMAAAEDQFRKTGEAIYTMTIMQTEFTKATEDQIDALRRMNESLTATWDGSGPGQRALDAIAQLVDLFKAGVLSLDGFNKNFAYLEEQLDRVIKAGGDLDGTLSGVLDALRKIAQQVRQGPGGGRPSGPVGY